MNHLDTDESVHRSKRPPIASKILKCKFIHFLNLDRLIIFNNLNRIIVLLNHDVVNNCDTKYLVVRLQRIKLSASNYYEIVQHDLGTSSGMRSGDKGASPATDSIITR